MNRGQEKKAVFLRMFAIFFLLIAFVLSSSMFLFIEFLEKELGQSLSLRNVWMAAAVTFGNVFLLSLVCTGVDYLRRKATVERPVKEIIRASEKVIAGDFTTRISYIRGAENGFKTIIDNFNHMVAELGSMETLRTDFIANVSHELKTPLAVIQNYGTILQNPDLTEEERKDCARAITGASRRLSGLITNILRLNKLENQQIFPEKTKIDLAEELCECLLGFEEAWEAKSLEIETELQDGVIVESDPELLSLVWNNLFSNAIKFTPEGGRIGLRLRTEEDWAVVEVSDTGCGISPETQAHIFEKFYQGDSSHAAQGNGLGLALVKRVADITGCELLVESEEGAGTTFTVRVPAASHEKA